MRLTTSHLWAERYDPDLNDIFALQDEISQAIVAALKIKLLPGERIDNRIPLDPGPQSLPILSIGAGLSDAGRCQNPTVSSPFL